MGEYEPNDSRNVTGTATTRDGRWTGQGQQPPDARGEMAGQQNQGHEAGEAIQFEPDPQLASEIEASAQMGQSELEQAPQGEPIGRAEQGGQLYASGRSQQSGSSGIADQMDQGGQSVGQSGEGVNSAANQSNDHTSGIGQEQQLDASQGELNESATAQAGQTGWTTANTAGQVRKGQSVVDARGEHVGTVDSVDGERIKLTRKDSPDGQHHYVSASQVESCEGDEVRLSCTADQLQS